MYTVRTVHVPTHEDAQIQRTDADSEAESEHARVSVRHCVGVGVWHGRKQGLPSKNPFGLKIWLVLSWSSAAGQSSVRDFGLRTPVPQTEAESGSWDLQVGT